MSNYNLNPQTKTFKGLNSDPNKHFLMDKLFNQHKNIPWSIHNCYPSRIQDSSLNKKYFLKNSTTNFK